MNVFWSVIQMCKPLSDLDLPENAKFEAVSLITLHTDKTEQSRNWVSFPLTTV